MEVGCGKERHPPHGRQEVETARKEGSTDLTHPSVKGIPLVSRHHDLVTHPAKDSSME